MPLLSIVAALSRNKVIGYRNQLPWHLPADLKHFKQLTLNKPVVMGRHTYESIGKPLPNRFNIILTRSTDLHSKDIAVAHSLDAAIALVPHAEEIMIIGGAQLYQLALPRVDRMYLTFIEEQFTGDTFFPEFAEHEWLEISRENHNRDEKNSYAYSFVTYQRVASHSVEKQHIN